MERQNGWVIPAPLRGQRAAVPDDEPSDDETKVRAVLCALLCVLSKPCLANALGTLVFVLAKTTHNGLAKTNSDVPNAFCHSCYS